jgi:hypothetical protein
MDGRIDEVQIYDRALSSEEVASIAAAGSDGLSKSAVLAPSPFLVTNTNDGGPGSLRWAITQADHDPNPGVDEIDFNIPTTDPGYHPPTATSPDWWTINLLVQVGPVPTRDLPITHPVFINSYSQPGASPNTQGIGDNAALKIELSPNSTGFGYGLNITSVGSTVSGLAIHGFYTDIWLSGGGGNTIAGCFVGTDIMGRPTSDSSP